MTSSYFGSDVDGPSTVYGAIESEQSDSTNESMVLAPSSSNSVGSQQSSGSSQSTRRVNAVSSPLPPIRQRSAGTFVPGFPAQRSAILNAEEKAELEYYRRMAFQGKGASGRGRGNYGRGSPRGRGFQP